MSARAFYESILVIEYIAKFLALLLANTFAFLVSSGAIRFARSEGLIPAPEPTHAIAATIREALRCRETGESKVILMAMCGHGHFDLPAYEKYLQGDLVDLSFSEEVIQESLAKIPQLVS
ncbi:unnamed protein product [Fraxinus pennsylvanica]|uniref:Tryptophan synthase n=1 Tax=Fraxinus pennsylvanica TaxID=56036 RepID=A0AAD2E8B6_9LAMI|nr:unnamed protein product [Fraxinus pennsylvanica]